MTMIKKSKKCFLHKSYVNQINDTQILISKMAHTQQAMDNEN